MHKYQENLNNKAEFFKSRHDDMRLAIKESEKQKQLASSLEQEDPWIEKQKNQDEDSSEKELL